MIELIKDYLNELLDKARDLAVDHQIDLKDSECVGNWRLEVETRYEKVKSRIKGLEACLKFLNEVNFKASDSGQD